MNFRTRYRLSAIPSFITLVTCASIVALVAMELYDPFEKMLREQLPIMPMIVKVAAIALPLLCCSWYALNYAEVRRGGRFRMRSLIRSQRLDLRRLESVYVFARSASNSKRKAHQLVLQLRDSDGREAWLPLNVWRDEDLLMARILRATVERKVTIEGDPLLVKRFGRLLVTYRSWDRQQAAA